MKNKKLENIIKGTIILLIFLLVLIMIYLVGKEIKEIEQCHEAGGVWIDYQCLDLPKLEL